MFCSCPLPPRPGTATSMNMLVSVLSPFANTYLYSRVHAFTPGYIPLLHGTYLYSMVHTFTPGYIPLLQGTYLYSRAHTFTPGYIHLLQGTYLYSRVHTFTPGYIPLLHGVLVLHKNGKVIDTMILCEEIVVSVK